MRQRWIPAIAAALLAGQSLAGQAHVTLAGHRREAASRRAELRPSYQVRLTSAWPQYVAWPGCVNGGEEELTGTLLRAGDGSYHGVLRRATAIRFCGSHGQSADACTLLLAGEDVVAAVAMVHEEDGQRYWVLRWAAPTVNGGAEVTGSCAPAFGAAVRRLYGSVAHALEVPLPTAPAGHRVHLEDFGWVAELR